MDQVKVFMDVYYANAGRCFFDKSKIIKMPTPSNFMHVLPKGKYPLFKYYHRNIVIGTLSQHTFEEMTNMDSFKGLRRIVDRIREHSNEREGWKKFIQLRRRLKQEYSDWKKEHKNEFKL